MMDNRSTQSNKRTAGRSPNCITPSGSSNVGGSLPPRGRSLVLCCQFIGAQPGACQFLVSPGGWQSPVCATLIYACSARATGTPQMRSAAFAHEITAPCRFSGGGAAPAVPRVPPRGQASHRTATHPTGRPTESLKNGLSQLTTFKTPSVIQPILLLTLPSNG